MKIAIDVVLLLSDEILDKTIELNKELLKNHENKIVLHRENCVPHISLAMGCIEEKDLSQVKKGLKEIIKEFKSFDLTALKLKADISPIGEIFTSIKIENNEKLQKFHEIIMKRLWKYFSYKPDKSMLFNSDEVEDITMHWIVRYAEHYRNPFLFDPHISIGFGDIESSDFPIDFMSTRLAIYQLGNYCTCRKELMSFDLR